MRGDVYFRFHRDIFEAGGVVPSKLFVIPEPVDVDTFVPPPASVPSLPSYLSRWMGVTPRKQHLLSMLFLNTDPAAKDFRFLSVFKWEYRKGWDLLLKAYFKEFTRDERVALVILTNEYHSSNDFWGEIAAYVQDWLQQSPDDAAVFRSRGFQSIDASSWQKYFPKVFILSELPQVCLYTT